MDFKSLRYVLAVAENKTMSDAARALSISQPSLSKYIQNLSDELGVALFDRIDGKLHPTYAGERYMEYAREILALSADFYQDCAHSDSEKLLRVACPPFEGSYLHPFAIKQFQQERPDWSLILTETHDEAALLRSGEADIAITNSELPGEDLRHILLAKDEVLLVTSKQHPIGKRAVWKEGCQYPWVDIGELWDEPLIALYPEQSTRLKAQELMGSRPQNHKIVLQTRSVLTAIRAASSGMGICFAPETAMRHFRFIEPPAFYSIGAPLMMDVFMVYTQDRPPSDEVEHFLEIVLSFF